MGTLQNFLLFFLFQAADETTRTNVSHARRCGARMVMPFRRIPFLSLCPGRPQQAQPAPRADEARQVCSTLEHGSHIVVPQCGWRHYLPADGRDGTEIC
ncbi:hypothetical protein CDAR_20831 [Caerostris darwini]|uniref:Secreted protein n=1 Tax=Caerostris darwini TaxID=1538125 RepID=A0AAV4NSN1_9ARAC|nr:hypothetical protein CDAR_20831 [Caerostris darwini]